jgi:hypothetical protein
MGALVEKNSLIYLELATDINEMRSYKKYKTKQLTTVISGQLYTSIMIEESYEKPEPLYTEKRI